MHFQAVSAQDMPKGPQHQFKYWNELVFRNFEPVKQGIFFPYFFLNLDNHLQKLLDSAVDNVEFELALPP